MQGSTIPNASGNYARTDGLWISDGTAAGTVEIGGIGNAGISGANSAVNGGIFWSGSVEYPDFFVYKGITLFVGLDSSSHVGLWQTDGTAAGTKEIGGLGGAGISGGLSLSNTNNPDFTLYNGLVLFRANDSTGHSGLWTTDGTAAGTHEITTPDLGLPLASLGPDFTATTGQASTTPVFPFTGDPTSEISVVYLAYYGRAGDPSGAGYWNGQLGSGADTLTQEAASFSVQAESLAQYPFLANPLTASTTGTNNALDGFINSVYQNLFGHAADGTDTTGGLGYWRGNILTALATGNAGTIANELGVFCLQVALGAQGGDQTALINKVTVADFFTQAFTSAGAMFTTQADALAHTALASVTSASSTVTAAEASITSFLTAHPSGASAASVSLVGLSSGEVPGHF